LTVKPVQQENATLYDLRKESPPPPHHTFARDSDIPLWPIFPWVPTEPFPVPARTLRNELRVCLMPSNPGKLPAFQLGWRVGPAAPQTSLAAGNCARPCTNVWASTWGQRALTGPIEIPATWFNLQGGAPMFNVHVFAPVVPRHVAEKSEPRCAPPMPSQWREK